MFPVHFPITWKPPAGAWNAQRQDALMTRLRQLLTEDPSLGGRLFFHRASFLVAEMVILVNLPILLADISSGLLCQKQFQDTCTAGFACRGEWDDPVTMTWLAFHRLKESLWERLQSSDPNFGRVAAILMRICFRVFSTLPTPNWWHQGIAPSMPSWKRRGREAALCFAKTTGFICLLEPIPTSASKKAKHNIFSWPRTVDTTACRAGSRLWGRCFE